MATKTFFNLNEEKKNRILDVLKEEFRSKPVFEVNVKDIVSKADIPRGSFYQYFENIEDSYFTVLEIMTVDVHRLLFEIIKENNKDLMLSLKVYGQRVSEILFDEKSYDFYRYRYLFWNSKLEEMWNNYRKDRISDFRSNLSIDMEKINFIKAVVHDLIKRIFINKWSKEEFLNHYEISTKYIEGGIFK